MAEGSHGTWDGIPPEKRVCVACGAKLRITLDNLWIDTAKQEAWHVACYHERIRALNDWRRLMQPRGPVEDDQAEWDRKRELEEQLHRTGVDPVVIEWPP